MPLNLTKEKQCTQFRLMHIIPMRFLHVIFVHAVSVLKEIHFNTRTLQPVCMSQPQTEDPVNTSRDDHG